MVFRSIKVFLPLQKSRGDKLQFAPYHYSLIHTILRPENEDCFKQVKGINPDQWRMLSCRMVLMAQLRGYQEKVSVGCLDYTKNGFGGCLAG